MKYSAHTSYQKERTISQNDLYWKSMWYPYWKSKRWGTLFALAIALVVLFRAIPVFLADDLFFLLVGLGFLISGLWTPFRMLRSFLRLKRWQKKLLETELPIEVEFDEISLALKFPEIAVTYKWSGIQGFQLFEDMIALYLTKGSHPEFLSMDEVGPDFYYKLIWQMKASGVEEVV